MIQDPCREAFVGGAGKSPGRLQANLVVTRATSAISLRLQYPHLDHWSGARWNFLICFGLGTSLKCQFKYLGQILKIWESQIYFCMHLRNLEFTFVTMQIFKRYL